MRTIVFVSALCALVSACGSQQNMDHLKETVIMFNEGVRWGRLQDVMPYLYAENAEHFIEMHKEFGKEIQLSDYEIINVSSVPEKQTAEVNVQITWYRLNQMEVHTTILKQHWERRGTSWMMIAEEIVSGEPF